MAKLSLLACVALAGTQISEAGPLKRKRETIIDVLHKHEHLYEHNCMHEEISERIQPVSINYAQESGSHVHRRQADSDWLSFEEVVQDQVNKDDAEWNEIRILPDYSLLEDPKFSCQGIGTVLTDTVDGNRQYTCTQADILTPEKKEYLIQKLVPATIEFYERVLKVRRFGGFKSLAAVTQDMCGLPVPVSLKQDRPEVDLVIAITAFPTKPGTLAWASACFFGGPHNRPVVGRLNVGPANLDPKDLQNFDNHVATVRHELAHVMAFSNSLYDKFVDNSGKPLPLTSVIKTDTATGVSKIVTPKVIQAMTQQYDCQQIDGAPLEDFGGARSAGSHWEKRLFRDEFMCATSTVLDPIYSGVTLALFEDSGWYQADYGQADVLPWGHKKGCSFVNGDCGKDTSGFFCSKPDEAGCTYDGIHKSFCDLSQQATDLPKQYQHFSDPKMGGKDAFMDYCPIMQAFGNGDCRDPSEAKPISATLGEVYSVESRCFVSNLISNVYDSPSNTRCFKHKCMVDQTDSKFKLYIQPNGYPDWVKCPPEGGQITFPKYKFGEDEFEGSVTCPPATSMCEKQNHMPISEGTWKTLWGENYSTLFTIQKSYDLYSQDGMPGYETVDHTQFLNNAVNRGWPSQRKLRLRYITDVKVKTVLSTGEPLTGEIIEAGKKILWANGVVWSKEY